MHVASAYAATQDSNQWHDCHAGQPQPGLARRLPDTDGAKVLPTSDQEGFSLRKHSPDGAKAHIRLNGLATHLLTSEGWKAELA